MSEQPPRTPGQYERNAPHLSVYLVWPLALGLCLSLVISLAVFGAQWKKKGLETALDAATSAFFWLWPILSIISVIFVVGQWAGPLILTLLQQTTVIREKETMQHHWTRLGGRAGRQSTHTPQSIETKRECPAWWPFKRRQSAYAQEIESIEPEADEWVKEAYDVICTLWNQDLTRAAFQNNWPRGGTEMYYRYVAGKNGVKGWFEQWNVLERVDGRGAQRFKCTLEEVLHRDDDLWAYATQKQALSPTLRKRKTE